MSLSYPYDGDIEWYAVDRSGYIARFTTGGIGPVPRGVRDQAQITLRDLIRTLPSVGGAELIDRYTNSSDFRDCAERGIFAYDWSDVHRVNSAAIDAYELIARPTTVLSLGPITERIQAIQGILPRFEVSFGDCMRLSMITGIEWLCP